MFPAGASEMKKKSVNPFPGQTEQYGRSSFEKITNSLFMETYITLR